MHQGSLNGDSISTVAAEPGTPENPLHKVATIPNLITFFRLVLTLVFLVLYQFEDLRTLAIIVFVVSASTDWIDGKVARRMHQVSWFGKRFDPIMDRVLIFSGIAALFLSGKVPFWIFAYIVLRDIYLAIGGAILLRKRGRIPDVTYVGKTCTFILMTGFAIILFGLFVVPGLGVIELPGILPGWGSEPYSIGIWLVYVGIILSISAAIIYTKRGIRILHDPEC